jgi:hypothetical protein
LLSISALISSPAAAEVFDFGSYAETTEIFDIYAENKIETTSDIWTGRIRVMNDQNERWGAGQPANDWPAPQYLEGRKITNDTWVQTTQVGARDLRNCDINLVATSVMVYDAINGPNGQINPPSGFAIKNGRTQEKCWVTGTGHYTQYDQFSGMARGWGGTTPATWLGHDRGAQSLGPPPVPPDTVHDPVLIKVFDTALKNFLTTGSAHASMLPRPITYAPKGSRNGIFMPIILRYLADRFITKTTTTTTTTTPGGDPGGTGTPVDPGIPQQPPDPSNLPTPSGPGAGTPVDNPYNAGTPDYPTNPEGKPPPGFLMM